MQAAAEKGMHYGYCTKLKQDTLYGASSSSIMIKHPHHLGEGILDGTMQENWVFGGKGPSPQYYLNDYGGIAGNHDPIMNNQLLCCDPNIQKWTNPQSFGNVPARRFNYASTIIKHNV